MKNTPFPLLVFIFSFLIPLSSIGQNSSREKELMAFEMKQDSLPRSIFLDSTDLRTLKQEFVGKTRQVWKSTKRETQKIEQFYDIRIKFDNQQEALDFHKKYWKENSEFGSPVKKHKVNTLDTEDFRVFNGNNVVSQMVAPYGLKMYCYIFVVDNYFVKFYISCRIDFEPNDIQPYLDSTISKIKAHKIPN